MKRVHSEEDIQKAIKYMKTNRPELEATREQAIKLLDTMENFAEVFAKTVVNKADSKKN
jgi:hypothetical protein